MYFKWLVLHHVNFTSIFKKAIKKKRQVNQKRNQQLLIPQISIWFFSFFFHDIHFVIYLMNVIVSLRISFTFF